MAAALMATYTVKQGDHLSSIAHEAGFSDPDTIWEDPQNADLKKQRVNPNILYPGDKLVIPEAEEKSVDCATEQRHKFSASKPKLDLVLRLQDEQGKGLAGAECTLTVEGRASKLKADDAGKIKVAINPDDKGAKVKVKDGDAPLDEGVPVAIGGLDPLDTKSGQIARLTNLAYFLGDPADPDDQDFQSAVEEFQCDQKLTVDGKCGPQTQAKLKDVHGS